MNDKTLVERLRRKVQKLPAQGSGFMSVDGEGNVTSGGHIYDDGKRLVNPDGPEAADALTTLSAENKALQSRIEALEAALRNPPRHKWWSAGEPDCPPELKAPNGELWRRQCKICGNGAGDGVICRGALEIALKGQKA